MPATRTDATITPTADEQNKLWNGPSGVAWVETQAVLDQMFQSIESHIVDSITSDPDLRVLDVGCGTGAVSLAIARRLRTGGGCLGVDLSAAMIAMARERAAAEDSPARFVEADAQVHPFEPGSFHRIVSRFGVMFFSDPARAFANLRSATHEGAVLHAIAWRGADENPFMTTAERAASPLLPNLPARKPGAPGQFAFADRSRVQRILAEAGWTDIEIQSIDFTCTLPESDLIPYLSRLGPVGLALHDVDARTHRHVIDTVRAAFVPYVHGDEVRFTAACWDIAAKSHG